MNKECVFCNINGERILRETKNIFTILSDPYLLKGHCLVIPKKHYENISQVPDWLLLELMKEVKGIEQALLDKFGASGCDIRQHYRPFQKESNLKVNHLHFHVIPRGFEDELYQKSMIYEKNVFKKLDEKTFEEVIKKLK